MTPSWYSEIDHTGDIGIAVIAPDRKTLFERAAWAMFAVLADLDSVRSAREFTVEADGEDRHDLMVRWLSELNFLHVTESVLLSAFRVTDLSDVRLTAVVCGEAIDADHHTIHTEIKAVTYHEMVMEEREDGWHAQVIFDV